VGDEREARRLTKSLRHCASFFTAAAIEQIDGATRVIGLRVEREGLLSFL
jgi:hypothetical protein